MFYHKCFDMRQSFNKFKNLNCVGKERINRAFCIHSNILIRQRGASIFLFLILVENQKLRLVPTLWCNFVSDQGSWDGFYPASESVFSASHFVLCPPYDRTTLRWIDSKNFSIWHEPPSKDDRPRPWTPSTDHGKDENYLVTVLLPSDAPFYSRSMGRKLGRPRRF